jgi:hypothetical protein
VKLPEAQEMLFARINKVGQSGYFIIPEEQRSAEALEKRGLIVLSEGRCVARPAEGK